MALVGVELQTLVSEPDALTTRPPSLPLPVELQNKKLCLMSVSFIRLIQFAFFFFSVPFLLFNSNQVTFVCVEDILGVCDVTKQ